MSWLRQGPHREQAEDLYNGTNEPAEQSLVDIIYQNQIFQTGSTDKLACDIYLADNSIKWFLDKWLQLTWLWFMNSISKPLRVLCLRPVAFFHTNTHFTLPFWTRKEQL